MSDAPIWQYWQRLQSRAHKMWDTTGVNYYWQAARGASHDTLKQTALSQAQRLGINKALDHKAYIMAQAQRQQQQVMKDIFAGF